MQRYIFIADGKKGTLKNEAAISTFNVSEKD